MNAERTLAATSCGDEAANLPSRCRNASPCARLQPAVARAVASASGNARTMGQQLGSSWDARARSLTAASWHS